MVLDGALSDQPGAHADIVEIGASAFADPACGTGNSPLYVAMARMKLEGEVLDLLVDLGDDH